MATAVIDTFQADVSYALSCLKRSSLVLKSGQEAAIRDVYDGNDVFVWPPNGPLRKEYLLPSSPVSLRLKVRPSGCFTSRPMCCIGYFSSDLSHG